MVFFRFLGGVKFRSFVSLLWDIFRISMYCKELRGDKFEEKNIFKKINDIKIYIFLWLSLGVWFNLFLKRLWVVR